MHASVSLHCFRVKNGMDQILLGYSNTVDDDVLTLLRFQSLYLTRTHYSSKIKNYHQQSQCNRFTLLTLILFFNSTEDRLKQV